MNSTSKKCLNLIGQRFGRLVVKARADDYIDPKSGKHKSRWLCDCDCGNEKIVEGRNLTSGKVVSCGCYHKEVSSITAKTKISHGKKYNTYDLSGKYGIGYTTKGEEFYFDLEDYDKIKDICWHINNKGYVIGRVNGRDIKMSRFIMNILDNETKVVDHIHADNKNDNRKSNLRITTQENNTRNRRIQKNNKSGFAGVWQDKLSNKWIAYINYKNKQIILGRFVNKEDAIETRKKAENEMFGEFRYIGDNTI